MKSFTVTSFGAPEKVVKLAELPKPTPSGDQVLVRVKAASINDYDWCVTSGRPFAYRLLFGLFKQKKRFQKLGMEVAGIVEEVGPDVKKCEVGDEVYGDLSDHEFGSLSEYVCVSECALTKKPEDMSFEDAAAIPHAAMLAYEALIDLGQLAEGQEILINGAGGGMGTFALQIAKVFNASVTGVDSGAKHDMMRSLGFDSVIDYRVEDFTKSGLKYDLILDARTSRSPFNFLRSLKKKGQYITVGGRSGKLIQLLVFRKIIGLFTGKRVKMLGLKPNKYLDQINKLYKEGKIKPVIDGPHPFERTPELIQYFGEANHLGKIVIKMN